MGTARRMAAAASLNGALYVTGGSNAAHQELSVVERYSPATNTWEPVASMTSRRDCHQLVPMGGALYAIGGYDVGQRVATAERYDPAANTWTAIASMATGRTEFAAAAMGGALYVTGGVEGPGAGPHVVLSRCERYDPVSNAWSRIADLLEPRFRHALPCLGGSLYAVGGQAAWSGFASTSPPWRFDPVANVWVVAPHAAVSTAMKGFGGLSGWAAL